MTRLAASSFLRRIALLALYACGVLVFGAALLRFAVWATGAQTIHPDISGGPHIFEWSIDDPAFGGMSALLMAPDGSTLFAGGDHGTLVEARVRRDKSGWITGIEGPVLTPVSLSSGLPPTTFKMDLEALARDRSGGLVTAFEGFVRIERLSAPAARPTATHPWDSFVDMFGNQAFEALATLPDGRLIAITEAPLTSTHAGSVIYDGKIWHDGPEIPVSEGFMITGADTGPDGCLYLVERRYTLASGFTSRLRRLSGGPQEWVDTPLYTTPPAQLGNVEGVAVWRDGQGQLAIEMLTDNGFWPFTPTRLIGLRAPPDPSCTLTF